MMTYLNRTAIVVRPCQPFLEWLHHADPTSHQVTLEDLGKESTVYLVPECDNDDEVRAYLTETCGQIFEEELDGWYRVPSSWPDQRDMSTFNRWFEWSFHTMVIDLSHDPLLHEEI
jgi:hypothetical protein